jgi:hypothetical protein
VADETLATWLGLEHLAAEQEKDVPKMPTATEMNAKESAKT